MHDEVTQHKQYVLKLELVEEVNVFKNEAYHGGSGTVTREIHIVQSKVVVPGEALAKVYAAIGGMEDFVRTSD
jgi:hypothetical protein